MDSTLQSLKETYIKNQAGSDRSYTQLEQDFYLNMTRNDTKTVRITVPLTGGGIQLSAVGAFQDWVQRLLIELPFTTTRWRILARNQTPLNDGVGAGPVSCTGVWRGDPSFAAARWAGAFTAVPTAVVPAFSLVDAGAADFATEWVTNTANQFAAGSLYGLSFGFTGTAATSFRYETPHATLFASGAGNAALAGGAAMPAIGGVLNIGTTDMRLEYEALVPASTSTLLVIGDSITQGAPGGDFGCFPHESWPGSVALRKRQPVINLGASSMTLANWRFGTGWRWTRADLATTVPDEAIINAGANDLNTAFATLETYLTSLVAHLRTRGIQKIWVATVIPRTDAGLSNDTNRNGFNAAIRAMPRGIAGVIDFDSAVRVDAAQNTADPQWVTTSPHPIRAGYQKMAAEVNL